MNDELRELVERWRREAFATKDAGIACTKRDCAYDLSALLDKESEAVAMRYEVVARWSEGEQASGVFYDKAEAEAYVEWAQKHPKEFGGAPYGGFRIDEERIPVKFAPSPSGGPWVACSERSS